MSLDYKAIGRRIRDKRMFKNFSQAELASKIGVSNPHISNIERGRTKVSLQTLVDIANALDITLDEIMCDNVTEAKGIYIKDIAEEINTCNSEDMKIVFDVVKTLVEGLKQRKND